MPAFGEIAMEDNPARLVHSDNCNQNRTLEICAKRNENDRP